jgi:ADP-ribose pyrophosphatase YjhB (NUDIX family)
VSTSSARTELVEGFLVVVSRLRALRQAQGERISSSQDLFNIYLIEKVNRENMASRPDITVAAVVERDGQFLIVEEHIGHQLVFNQPAGHLENGESLIDATIRETLEETAWEFQPQYLVGIYVWKHPQTQRTFVRVALTGQAITHHPHQPLDHGIVRAVWMSREQLHARPTRLRSPLVLRCIDDYLAGARYPLAVMQHLVEQTAELVESN